jgi:hypothetical protein
MTVLHKVILEKWSFSDIDASGLKASQIAAIGEAAVNTKALLGGIYYLPLFAGMGTTPGALAAARVHFVGRFLSSELLAAWSGVWSEEKITVGSTGVTARVRPDLSDKLAEKIICKDGALAGKGTPKLFADFTDMESVTMCLHMVGSVIITRGTGENIAGAKYPSGNITIGESTFNMFITCDNELADCRGSICVPAWMVKVNKAIDPEKPEKKTKAASMAVQSKKVEIEVPSSVSLGLPSFPVTIDVRSLVPVRQDGVCEASSSSNDVHGISLVLELSRAHQDSDQKRIVPKVVKESGVETVNWMDEFMNDLEGTDNFHEVGTARAQAGAREICFLRCVFATLTQSQCNSRCGRKPKAYSMYMIIDLHYDLPI